MAPTTTTPTGTPMPAPSLTDSLSPPSASGSWPLSAAVSVATALGAAVVDDIEPETSVVLEVLVGRAEDVLLLLPDTAGPDGVGDMVVRVAPALTAKTLPG